jgi:transcriptional regulator with XRE-family HTH domain
MRAITDLPDVDVAEIDARLRVARILGDARTRREARERLGLTLRDVAELTGLSAFAIWKREQVDDNGEDAWRRRHDSLTSAAGLKYVEFLRRARGLK